MKDKNFKKLFLLILYILSIKLVLSEQEKTCVEGPDQTCEGTDKLTNKAQKKNINKEDNFNDIKYSDNFLSQPIITKDNINTSNYNSTEYFDLSINKNILKFIRKNGVIPYPHQRFKEKQQGNFLHFMHLAYEKNLPVYFTIDQILYPYIEITKQLNYDIIEFVFHPVYTTFLNNIINYGNKNKYNKSIVLYFSLSAKFLDYDDDDNNKNNENIYKKIENENVEEKKLCQDIVNQIFTRDSNDTDFTFNFTLLGNKRSLNKLNFIKTKKMLKKGNIISQKITNSLRFFQEFVFDASKELYNVYLVGKLIAESGQEKIYLKIKKFVQYLLNEEEYNMNPLEIYHYINNNYKDIINNEEEINKLYEKIKEKIQKPKYFSFLKYINFISKEQEKMYYEEKNKDINLFSYSTNIEDWVNNKMVNFEKGRLFPSIVEFFDIVYDAKLGRKTIINRFNTKEVKNKFFVYRDGTDMMKELNETKKLIEQSFKEEKNKWINSYENSFNYLLNIIGRTVNETNRNSLIKSFNSIMGSYVHFKNDILLIQQYSNVTCAKQGNIPEIIFENNTVFYNEIKAITKNYRDQIINIIDCFSDNDKKEKIIEIVDYKLNQLFKAYDNILKILNNKDKKSKKTNKDIIDEMFYYDIKSNQYQGWYVNLFKNNHFLVVYNLDIYGYNYYIANPIQELKFDGAIVYEVMYYPEIGLIAVDDEDGKGKKLYLFASYTGNEHSHGYIEKIDFKGLQELIVSRKY